MAATVRDQDVAPVESSSYEANNVTLTPISDIAPDQILSVPTNPEEEDLYSADDYPKEKKIPIPEEEVWVESKKKKAGLEDAPIEETAPPPYTPAAEEVSRKPFWKGRWLLIAAIIALLLLIVILAISLGVALSKKHSKSASSAPSTGTSSSIISSVPSARSSTNSLSPSATPTVRSGNASPPLRNTAISGVSISDTTSSNKNPLVQIFFQDRDYYLCSKTSTAGVETWPLSNSGTRLLPALNSTPIVAVHQPDFQIPIRVFFINANGYLADIYQSTWGGAWINGSLADRQFRVGQQFYGEAYNSIAAGWCSSQDATVFAMGTDLRIYAFQSSGEDAAGNGGTWSLVWQSDKFFVSLAVNIAALCVLPIDPAPPVLFVNQFNGIESTGQLISVINGTNVTIPFPPDVASRYRPNSPIAAVYGSFAPAPTAAKYASNNTMFLFFPLPNTLNNLSPNPSLHVLSADPYWSAKEPYGGSFIATMFSLNWTDTQLVDTGVVPYANGASVLFGNKGNNGGPEVSIDNNIAQTMPRAWTPLMVGGRDGEPSAIVMIVYQDDKGAIQLSEVIGGQDVNYPVINID